MVRPIVGVVAWLLFISLGWAQSRPPTPPPPPASDMHERDLQERMDALHRLPLENKTEKQTTPQGSPSTISILDLNVPEKPRSEFNKGLRELEKREFEKAAAHFRKALELYPKFVAAHNDLGVVYLYQGDNDRAHQEFEAAKSLNNRVAMIYENLCRVSLATKNFADAEAQARTAAQLEPRSPEVLTLLAFSQFSNREYADAVKTGHLVHAGEHKNFSISHVIAAYALEAQNQLQDAQREYEMFVQEDPDNPRAALARARATELAKQLGTTAKP